MATIGSLGSNKQSGVYSLVQQYMSLEQTAYNRLQTQKSELTQRQTVLNDLSTTVRGLRSAIYDFSWEGSTNPVNTFTTTSSDEAVVTATATGSVSDGAHVVAVRALAQAHSIASSEFTAEGEANLAGAHTFRLEQDGATFTVNVTIEEGATYAEVMRSVATAINDSGAQVVATVAATDSRSGLQRLLLRSEETGTEALISVVKDEAGDLAAALGLTGESSVAGGYSANTVQEAADAEFTVDGLDFVSTSNSATGVLTGLNLDLVAVGEDPVTVTIARDVAQIRQEVQTVLDAYNKLLAYVRDKTRGADENGENRGLLAGDTLYTTLRGELRNAMTADVPDTTGASTLVRLAQLGITADQEGRLSIKDKDAFEDALADNPRQVERLFTDEEDGLAVRMVALMDRYTGTGGLLDQQTSVLRSRQRALNERITREESRLSRREEQLTNQLANLQVMAQQLQQQQQIINIMSGYTSS